MPSIIVPAYNESAVIGRCLSALNTNKEGNNELEVIVICNGCTDNSAEIARSFPNVQVLETSVSSKTNALNLGERVANTFPRLFLDADLIISRAEIERCFEHLNKPGIHLIAPPMDINLDRSPTSVRAYYAIWKQLPYFKSRVGGVFAISKAGRERFGEFPNIIADDAFVRAHFDENERLVPNDCSFEVAPPRSLKDLVKIKTRSRFGNVQLRSQIPDLFKDTENAANSLLALLFSKPSLIPAAIVYAYIQLMTYWGCKKRLKSSDYHTWERDDSSRTKD